MKKLGIIGGLGPESTVDYYRSFIAAYRSRINDGSYPNFVVNSINLTRVMAHVAAAQEGELVDFLADELEVLAKAGADLALHGHAHKGREEGCTPGGTPVRNVAMPVIGAAYRVFALAPSALPRCEPSESVSGSSAGGA